MGHLYQGLRALYEEEGGALPDPVLGLDWYYADPGNPSMEELAKEVNGKDLTTGEQLSTFGDLRDDGTTSSGDWIYCGSWTEEGNQMDRRGTDDPTGLGYFHDWAWSWPLNRRVMYNRASADADGQPWDPTRPGIEWNGSAWVGDVPDFPADSAPDGRPRGVHHDRRGRRPAVRAGGVDDGRAVPGALRADRVADRQPPLRCPAQPGDVPLRRRAGELRRGRLPSSRTWPPRTG